MAPPKPVAQTPPGTCPVNRTLYGNAPGRSGGIRGAVPDAPSEKMPGDGRPYGTGPVRRLGRLEPARKLLRDGLAMGAPLAGVSGPAATDRPVMRDNCGAESVLQNRT